MTKVTAETLEDWGTSLATGVEKLDPLRGAPVVSALMQLCAPQPAADTAQDKDTSFIVCARLYALQVTRPFTLAHTASADTAQGKDTSFIMCARLYALRKTLFLTLAHTAAADTAQHKDMSYSVCARLYARTHTDTAQYKDTSFIVGTRLYSN